MNRLLLLSILATVGPVIGSLIGIMHKPSRGLVGKYLSYAAGIMLGISLINLLPEGWRLTTPTMLFAGIASGIIVMSLIEWYIPHVHFSSTHHGKSAKLERTAIVLIIGILIHDFPEGLAIGIGSAINLSVALAIGLSIAIHQIPESICSSAPYYLSTGKRLKSFLVSSSTAIPTIMGILIAGFFLNHISSTVMGTLIGLTIGIMLHLTFFELIPAAKLNDHRIKYAIFVIGILSVGVLSLI